MEGLGMNPAFWSGRRVFITGHTGFKGSWLSLWLQELGAQVTGYALEPPTQPNLFELARLGSAMTSVIGDIRDLPTFRAALIDARPEVVFHLAAQPLVRESYRDPVGTYATNVLGTVHLLEALRHTPGVRAVVNVTTDKCYENREWLWPYRENEPLGGADPYSSSKACVELVTAAYRTSFLNTAGIHLASARAGNVIGGGDWATDRLIPDFLRALDENRTLKIRSPQAIRPWQHVLEPLGGYLILAEKLHESGAEFAEAWNFGPDDNDARPVRWIVEHLGLQMPNADWQADATPQPHEANALKLDSSKSRARLGWRPRWDLETALNQTLAWHLAWRQGADMTAFSLRQIHAYEEAGQTA
jgi:CDP-glucose 4,6-dehydratase